jgi:hypothetical protein
MSLIFRYGFDYLRNVMLNLEQKMVQFLEVLQFLSCAYSGFHSRGVGGGWGFFPPPPLLIRTLLCLKKAVALRQC